MSTTSKLLDNKQLIHIGAEAVVLLGLTFYFSSKNRKLMEHIEELAQRLEDQEDKIQKLESAINNIGNVLQNRVIPSLSGGNTVPAKPVQRKQRRKAIRTQPQPAVHVPQPVQSVKDNQVIEVVEDDDSDLDAEIREELDELHDSDEQEAHLKKQ